MRNTIKTIIRYVLTICLMIVIFIGLLYLAMLIPNEKMKQNVIESEEFLESKGLAEKVGKTILDNWTDAVMINTAYSVDSLTPLESLIYARRSYSPNRDLTLYGIEENKSENPIQDLKENIEEKNTRYYEYSRYWHGYLIFLRPLLCLCNYETIRIILVAIIDILSLVLIYLVFKKIDKIISLILAILMVYASFQILGMSITYFSVTSISIIFSIYIIQKRNISPISFFIVGGITSFFDLLTTPILTLGLPLIIYLIANKEECSYKKLFIMCLNWVIGYVTIWISKWIISSIICNNSNLITERGIEKIIQRTGNKIGEINIHYINVIKCNFRYYQVMIITNMIILITTLVMFKYKLKKEDFKYIIISLMPFAWYFVTQNHSYIHAKFTHRILFITMLSLSILSYKIINEKIKEAKNTTANSSLK